VRGGKTILIKHDEAWEAFVHNTYLAAADKAIEWINTQGDEMSASNYSKLNRAERRAFDARRRAVHKRKRGLL
jgi:hypothetical protein